MKKHHLILVSSLIFTLLFYNESVGLNLAIFGLALTGFICYFYREKLTSRSSIILVATSVLSCFAFAWYEDFVSFCALAISVCFLQFKVQEEKLKVIMIFPLAAINGVTSLGRMLIFSQWLPRTELKNNFAKKLIAYFLIPTVFVLLFFIVYAYGSDHFSSLITDYTIDLNIWQVLLISLLGFYISFSFWNYWIPQTFYDHNSMLDNDFKDAISNKNERTFSFLDLDFQRRSGEITLLLLNGLLLVFIATYNYEQFFEVIEKSKLSSATHEGVNAVIFSIVMAVALIMFYFKGSFNFDEKAKNLKRLSKIWIVLNSILIVSTIIKNFEYVSHFGLTYKRVGVCAFLILAIIGLLFTLLKILNQKTNAYLFNQMVWYFYGTILLCSFINWGNLITNYNISVNKGVEPTFLSRLNFNDEARRNYFSVKKLDGQYPEILKEEEIESYQNNSFLSKVFYYESLSKKE